MIEGQALVVLYGLLASLSYGTADFNGGAAARQLSATSVVALAHAFGPLLVLGLALMFGEAIPPATDFVWGALAGLAGAFGLVGLYRGLAVGQSGVVAPTVAVISSGIPVAVGLIRLGLPGGQVMAGLVLGLAAVWMVSQVGEASDGRPRGLRLAILSGVSFGIFYLLLDRIEGGSVFWPLVAARLTSTIVMLTLALIRRERLIPPNRTALLFVLLAGGLDVAGNTFFILAARAGRLDEAALVTSLYPMVTVLLARLVYKERLRPVQVGGIAAALLAIALIGSG